MLNRDSNGRRICPYCHGEPDCRSRFDPESSTYSVQFSCKGCHRGTKIYKDYRNGADSYKAAEKDFDEGEMA